MRERGDFLGDSGFFLCSLALRGLLLTVTKSCEVDLVAGNKEESEAGIKQVRTKKSEFLSEIKIVNLKQ